MPSADDEESSVPEPTSPPANPEPKPGESPFERPSIEPGKKSLDDPSIERRESER